MPEIKFKHVVSFSSEDKVYKAENLINPEGYLKWKCAAPGEKNASVILQFEKASQIHSIDIGNEGSAFVEVLVGRSSDTVNDFQVLLVASSFMSPAESRNKTQTNRVRMFGPEKLAQNVKDEKWDCVQIVCTQPFNKNVTYGLSFVKFHSPADESDESSKPTSIGKAVTKLGAFKLKTDEDEDEEESLPKIGSWFGKKKDQSLEEQSDIQKKDCAPSYAAAVLAAGAAKNSSPKQDTNLKRRTDSSNPTADEPPAKKIPSKKPNSDFIVYKPLDVTVEKRKESPSSPASSKNILSDKATSKKSLETSCKSPVSNKTTKKSAETLDTPSSSKTSTEPVKKQVPFSKIMEKVVFVLSGFVNPLRSEIRDKALEMGAKYKGDWEKSCTHLVCAFINTPKYIQVRGMGGRVVTKEWILDCHKKKSLLPWRDYMLGKYDVDSSEDSGSEAAQSSTSQKPFKKSKAEPKDSSNPKVNGAKIPSKPKSQPSVRARGVMRIDSSYSDDDDALSDYIADTDDDSDSEGDTEDEILKVEKKLARKKKQKPNESRNLKKSSVEELTERPDVEALPLPDLPNFFKKKHFFLFGEFSKTNYHQMTRYIVAYNGVIEDYMSDTVKYVITEESWDKNFEDALSENEDLIFIKPSWIYKCHEAGKFVPYHPFLITPPES